ncbi:MAG TPA: hypothetical protein VGH34_02635 [Vicinamibacterales bacterium]
MTPARASIAAAVFVYCAVAALAQSPVPAESAKYVGSAACASCHAPIYARWQKTRMANIVRDPREHPDAIIPDLSTADPLVTFTKDQIAFVYGSKWKQRYFTRLVTTTSRSARSGT